MIGRIEGSLKWLWLAALAMAGLLPSPTGAQTTRTWIGPTSGNQTWHSNANWDGTGDTVPNNGSSTGENAVIADTLSGSRVITLGPITFRNITWSSDTSTFVDTLRLTGDVNTPPAGTPITINNTGDAAQKVLDLNGFHWSAASGSGGVSSTSGPFTISSTTTGGMLSVRAFGRGTVQDGVTIRIVTAVVHSQISTIWEDGALLEVASAFRQSGVPSNGYYDVKVTGGTWTHEQGGIIRNDLLIDEDSALGWRNANRTLRVRGDFTDLNAGNLDYPRFDASSSGTVVFDGGAVTPRTVEVHRTGIASTGFRVGFDAATPGNIRLAHDLKTTSTFGVMANSVLDTQAFTVDAGVTSIGSATDPALLTFDFSDADTGRIAVTNLTLNDFSLALEQSGPWTNGQDLILMTYSGAFSGAAELRGLTAPQGFSYDQLLTSNGSVRLTNVNIIVPEPAGIALFATGAGLLLFRRR